MHMYAKYKRECTTAIFKYLRYLNINPNKKNIMTWILINNAIENPQCATKFDADTHILVI